MVTEPGNEPPSSTIDMTQKKEGNIVVYPNPGNGIFTIDFKQHEVKEFTLKVLDTYGKKLSERKYTGGKQNIDLAHLPKGVYILYVNSKPVNESFKVVIK
jgi:hypothetical protein